MAIPRSFLGGINLSGVLQLGSASGASGEILTSAGTGATPTWSNSISVSGDIVTSGYFRSNNSSGDEGGEIFLSKSVTNTSITNGVTIDVYQNKLRFFEQGGSARGFYLDITAGGTGASTNLATGGSGGSGTVTSVAMTVPTGLSISGSPITSSGTLALTLSSGYSIPTTSSQSNWDTAYSERAQWDGGSTNLNASTGRASLGATTVGSNIFTLTNPSTISWIRMNADNTVTARSAANTRTDLGGTTVGQNLFTLTNPSAVTFPRINADNTVTALSASAFKTAIGGDVTFHSPVSNYTIATTTSGSATISGSAFSKIPTLSNSTTYLVEGTLFLQSTIGSGTGSNLILSWTNGGTGATANIQMMINAGLASLTTSTTTTTSLQNTNYSNNTLISSPAGTQVTKVKFNGVIRTGSSGAAFYPSWSITNSGTPGVPTSITTLVGSYMQITPLTASGSDVTIGSWA